MEEPTCHFKKESTVLRTVEKIRAASYRVGFNLWHQYKPLDPDNNRLISMSKFISVLAGPLKKIIGLSSEEITQVAQYFRMQDGRVMWTQFCDLVHGKTEPGVEVQPTEAELYSSNSLSAADEKLLLMMLTKMAVLTRNSSLPTKPYFQDYNLVSKKWGLMTRAHFSRVLSLMGVALSIRDYHLLLRKYSRDGYTLSYVAFLRDLDRVARQLELQGDGGPTDLLNIVDGKVETKELTTLPRPEICTADEATVAEQIASRWKAPSIKKTILPILEKIQSHLFSEKLRIGRLLQEMDRSGCGRVTRAQFQLALQKASESSGRRNHLVLEKSDLRALSQLYADPADPERVLWKLFAKDVEAKWEPKVLEAWDEERALLLGAECARRGRERAAFLWAQQEHPAPPPSTLAEVLGLLKQKTLKRNIHLKPSFLNYDMTRMGVVDRADFRRVLIDNCLLCTSQELGLLELAYLRGDDFHYTDLLDDLLRYQVTSEEDRRNEELLRKREADKIQKEKEREKDVIEVLAKIKSKVIRMRKNTWELLEGLEIAGTGHVARNDFERALSDNHFSLTPTEFETLFLVFRDPVDPSRLEARRFSSTVDEEALRLDSAGHPEPPDVSHLHPFMNFEQRTRLSTAMKKLSNSLSLGSLDLFKSLDPDRKGYISKLQVMDMFHSKGILHLLSMSELDTIMMGFGVPLECADSYGLDYLSLLNAVDIIIRTQKAASVTG